VDQAIQDYNLLDANELTQRYQNAMQNLVTYSIERQARPSSPRMIKERFFKKCLQENLTVLVTKTYPSRTIPGVTTPEIVDSADSTIWLQLVVLMQQEVKPLIAEKISPTIEGLEGYALAQSKSLAARMNRLIGSLQSLYNQFLLLYYAAEYGQYRYVFHDRYDGSDDLLIGREKENIIKQSGVLNPESDKSLFTLYENTRSQLFQLQSFSESGRAPTTREPPALVIEPLEEKQEKYDRLLAYIQSKYLWPKEVMSYAKASKIL
jgi:hypothetical protein